MSTPAPPPRDFDKYELKDFRDSSHYTKRLEIDDATDQDKWGVRKLRTYVTAMREAVFAGYGNTNDTTMFSRWGMHRYEVYKDAYKHHSDDEKAKLPIGALAPTGSLDKPTLLPIAGYYRFNDYRLTIGNVQSYSFKDYRGPEKGFNPYRLSALTVRLLGKGKFTFHFLRYNETTGIFHAPQLEDEDKRRNLDYFVMKFDLTTELQMSQDENAQLKKKNDVQSNLIRSLSPPRNNNIDGTSSGDRMVAPPVRVDPPPRQPPGNATSSAPSTSTATGQQKPMKYDSNGVPIYCTFCRSYAGHIATRADCEPMRIAKPAGCWNCGYPAGRPDSHLASVCPNPKVQGVQWNPGYAPKPGSPNRAGIVQNRNTPRSGKVFQRTNLYDGSPPDIAKNDDPDSSKLIARNISERFVDNEYPPGIKELAQSVIEARRMDEKDLADRENANNYEQDRKYREYFVEKEIAQRSFFIGNIDEKYLPDFTVKNKDDQLDVEAIKVNITKRLHTETKHELDPQLIRKFSTFTKKITSSEPGNPVEFTVFDLRVELYSREAILRLLDHVDTLYKDYSWPIGRDIGTPPQEFLLKREINNDNWVRAKVDSNNESLSEERKQQGKWVIGGKRGVTRPWFKKTEETIQKEKELAQKRREALKRKASQEGQQLHKKLDDKDTPNKDGNEHRHDGHDSSMTEDDMVDNGLPRVINNNA